MAQQSQELYNSLLSHFPQPTSRTKRLRPAAAPRSVSSTINSLISWSAVYEDSAAPLFPMLRRRSSDPFRRHMESRKNAITISTTDLAGYHLKSTSPRQDSACAVEKDRPRIAVISAGPEHLRQGGEFENAYRVTSINIDSRQHYCAFRKSAYRRRSRVSELKYCLFFVVRVKPGQGLNGMHDTSRLESAMRLVAQYAQPGATIIIESTTAVGTTRWLCESLVKRRQLQCGFASPSATSTQNPIIIAGLDDLSPSSTESIASFYKPLCTSVIRASTVEMAEKAALYIDDSTDSAHDLASDEEEEFHSCDEEVMAVLAKIATLVHPV